MSELRRDLGLVDAVAVGLGAIVGGGLFVVTGLAAGLVGPAMLVSLLLAALAAGCNALSSASLAARFPRSGGTYEYGYELLNPWAGFAAGWTFLASKIAVGGTVALGFGEYLSRLVPGVEPRAAGFLAVLGLMGANLLGIKKAGRLNLLIVGITCTTLLLFVVGTAPEFDPARFHPFAPEGWSAVPRAAALLFFTYTGYARIATLAEEVHEPQRTIPRAIVLSLCLSGALYIAVIVAALGAVGAEGLSSASAPLVRAAEEGSGSGLGRVIGIGATTAMLGVLLSGILGVSRVMLAMARRQDLPSRLAHVSSRGVPDRAVVLTGIAIALLTLFGTIGAVAASATFAILLYYAITNLAALRLPRGAPLVPRWVSALGLLFCLGLALSLDLRTIIAGLGVLVVGCAYRALTRSRGGRSGRGSR